MSLTLNIISKNIVGDKLDLSGKNLCDSDIRIICEFLSNQPTIKTLDVGWNQIGDSGAKELAAINTITTLYVSGNQIGDSGAMELATNQVFKKIDVSFNNIKDEGAKGFAANKTLTSINVSWNQIGDAGAKELAANKTIINLDVSDNNQISDEVKRLLSQRAEGIKTWNKYGQALKGSDTFFGVLSNEMRAKLLLTVTSNDNCSLGSDETNLFSKMYSQ